MKRAAEDLLSFYQINRRVGHTQLMVNGLLTYNGDFFLLAHTIDYATRLVNEAGARGRGIPISWSNFDLHRTAGCRLPMAVDNSAVLAILISYVDAVSNVEERIKREVAAGRASRDMENYRLRKLNAQLLDQIDDFKAESFFSFMARKFRRAK